MIDLKNILPRIFAFWALIVFSVSITIVAILLLFTGWMKEPHRTAALRKISIVWIRSFFFLTGCRLRVKGKQHFRKGQQYVVTCNHNSFLDVTVLTPFVPGTNKTIAKAEMARIPIFGLVYKRGSVLVDRKDKASRQQSFLRMKQVLAGGMHMCIYPEGTRNKTGEPLKSFHDGAFRLALDTGTPIIPTLIFNTKNILPANKKFWFKPALIELHFLPEVAPMPENGFESLKEKVFGIMQDYYIAHLK